MHLYEALFGTGNTEYDRRFGKHELAFIRKCRKIKNFRHKNLARAAALSAREMNHWLFLNSGSLFRRYLVLISAEDGWGIYVTWFSICLSSLAADDELPPVKAEDFASLENLITGKCDPAAGGQAKFISQYNGYFSDRSAYRQLVQEVLNGLGLLFPEKPGAEETMTFGILLGQMISNAGNRYRLFIPRV